VTFAPNHKIGNVSKKSERREEISRKMWENMMCGGALARVESITINPNSSKTRQKLFRNETNIEFLKSFWRVWIDSEWLVMKGVGGDREAKVSEGATGGVRETQKKDTFRVFRRYSKLTVICLDINRSLTDIIAALKLHYYFSHYHCTWALQ
jgi:hypothetical protein